MLRLRIFLANLVHVLMLLSFLGFILSVPVMKLASFDSLTITLTWLGCWFGGCAFFVLGRVLLVYIRDLQEQMKHTQQCVRQEEAIIYQVKQILKLHHS